MHFKNYRKWLRHNIDSENYRYSQIRLVLIIFYNCMYTYTSAHIYVYT